MKLSKKAFGQVTKQFANINQQPDPNMVDAKWQKGVMRDIRHIGQLGKKEVRSQNLFLLLKERIQQNFWSFVPVTCAIILLLVIRISSVDIGAEYEITQFFYNSQTEVSLDQEFGFDTGNLRGDQ